MQLSPSQTKVIGSTIRTVAANQSKRFFKSDANNRDRSAAVFLTIFSSIPVALLDAGIPKKVIMDVDPTEDILDQMEKEGYVLDREQLGGVPR